MELMQNYRKYVVAIFILIIILISIAIATGA